MINIVFVDPHMESIGHWIKWKQGFKLWFPHHDRNCCYTSHIVLQLFTTFLTTTAIKKPWAMVILLGELSPGDNKHFSV